ncbi:MAG: winged helix-turn-helix domain-containing protein [Candidatus Dormibacteraceae bacterium]
MDGLFPDGRELIGSTDIPFLEREKARFEERLQFWRRRHRELQGIDFRPGDRTLRHDGASVTLSRREAELFSVLLDHPGHTISARELVWRAWREPGLSAEQLRTYVVRLRRKLEELGTPCRLVTRPRKGYALECGDRIPPR